MNTIEKSDEQDKDKDMTGHPKSNEPVLIEHFNMTGSPGASESASASASAGAVASASAATAATDVAVQQRTLFGVEVSFPDRPTGS